MFSLKVIKNKFYVRYCSIKPNKNIISDLNIKLDKLILQNEQLLKTSSLNVVPIKNTTQVSNNFDLFIAIGITSVFCYIIISFLCNNCYE